MVLQGMSGLDGAQTILDLTDSIPDIISDLLGYSVVPQQLQENQLQAGEMFNTTNVVKTGNGVNGVPAYIPIEIKSTGTVTQVDLLRAAAGYRAVVMMPDNVDFSSQFSGLTCDNWQRLCILPSRALAHAQQNLMVV